ncbi:ABC transporter permease [Shewanella sp. SR44-3]|uniref:ABC transporter permease n=1 Tax=unclassified Shewanella TaxID=196818 RepID=UPI0015FA59EA|nr:ABC transporter permease [Shewanella sp. SR44-3]MBB1270023.1 ABC transporter permease [Shewanella sp. SR44-3]
MFFYYCDLAWRSIKKTPALSVLMVLAISVGIGITITTLNVYQMMANNPAGERSVQLNAVMLWSQGPDTWTKFNQSMTYQDAMGLRNSNIPRRQVASFRTGMAVQSDNKAVEPELQGIRVTDSDFFSMFSVPFLFGDTWDKGIDTRASYQVVISEALNLKHFNGANSVGKNLYLNGKPYQIAGVIKDWNPQPKYYDPTNGAFNDAEEIYLPFSLTPIEEFEVWGNTNGWQFEPMDNYQDRLNSEKAWVQFWVELNSSEQKASYQEWLTQYVEKQKSFGRFKADKSPKDSNSLKDVQQWLEYNKAVSKDNKILVGLSFLFLAVCLVNILGLMLTKFLKRAPEVGVRRAIGASRGQIFSQYMVEVGVIGLLGGVIGLIWAWVALSVLAAHFDMAKSLTQLDLSMWFITPAIAISTAVLAGLYPAWVVCRTNPSVYLKSQ